MRIVIAGASGLIGHALAGALASAGHEVRKLSRGATRNTNEFWWDPASVAIDGAVLDGADAVVNLAGENIGAGRWTAERQRRILESRVSATRTLVRALGAAPNTPRILINASAVGAYGDRGDDELPETSGLGDGFLAEVCQAWEGEALKAEPLGTRVALLRFGLVLAPDGGALAKMLPLFRLGLGGRLGSGRQWMSWVHIDDVVGIALRVLEDRSCSGAFNVTAPNPVTNAEFTKTLAGTLGRPALLPAPAWGLRAAFGRMADEALLASTRAVPSRLVDKGYVFRFPVLRGALESVLSEDRVRR